MALFNFNMLNRREKIHDGYVGRYFYCILDYFITGYPPIIKIISNESLKFGKIDCFFVQNKSYNNTPVTLILKFKIRTKLDWK